MILLHLKKMVSKRVKKLPATNDGGTTTYQATVVYTMGPGGMGTSIYSANSINIIASFSITNCLNDSDNDGICDENETSGCTDPSAINYNADAEVDDGSCIDAVLGCTDENADNYNPDANTDDGSCSIAGCTNENASNYNPLATVDDGNCIIEGCMEATAFNYSADATLDDGSCLGIGDSYQGGIIFWIDGNGGGLIAAPSDQSTGAQWGCYGTYVGASGTSIGTGAQNTINIEFGCTTSGTAADICANLTLGGYTDWFLPSRGELYEMYLNIGQGNALGLGNIGGFAGDHYWSSTEDGSYYAWVRNFNNGSQYGNNKAGSVTYVRAVRAF